MPGSQSVFSPDWPLSPLCPIPGPISQAYLLPSGQSTLTFLLSSGHSWGSHSSICLFLNACKSITAQKRNPACLRGWQTPAAAASQLLH